MANRISAIDDYVRELGIEDDALAAAVTYARWSAAAEYRLFAAAGIHVDDISWEDLEPFLGRGRTPVLETIKLSDMLDYKRQNLELVARAQGQDDAFGCDKFVMLASIQRQIYQRAHHGFSVSTEEIASLRTCYDVKTPIATPYP